MLLHDLHRAHCDRLARMNAAAKKAEDATQKAAEEAERARLQRHAKRTAWLTLHEQQRDERIAELRRERQIMLERIKAVEPGISKVLEIVCAAYDLHLSDLKSRRKDAVHVIPRQVAYYLMTTLAHASRSRIGRLLQRDHATVLHAIHKITALRTTDPQLDAKMIQMEAVFRENDANAAAAREQMARESESDRQYEAALRDHAEWLRLDSVNRGEQIKRFVCEYYQISTADLASRRLRFVRVRHIGYYLVLTHTCLSLSAVGRLFGDHSHTTPKWGRRTIARLRAENQEFDAEITALEAKLREADK